MKGHLTLLCLWLACLLAVPEGPLRAATIPDSAIGATDGIVNALAIKGQVLYIGGNFKFVFDGSGLAFARNNLAAIDVVSGVVTPWNPDATGIIESMALSGDGRALYVGGSFSTIDGMARRNLAVIDTQRDSNNIGNWNPDPDAVVRALALSVDNLSLYVGGDFQSFQGGSIIRRFLASLNPLTAAVNSWQPAPDGAVYVLLPAPDGASLYVGGDFLAIGGQARSHLATVDLRNAQANAWNPAPDNRVRALALAGSLLYAGGDFTAVDGGVPGSHNHLAALDITATTPGSIASGWNPDVNGIVRALSLSFADAIVYIGGDFTAVNGGAVPRARLAALQIAVNTNNATAWDPGAVGPDVRVMLGNGDRSRLFSGGAFTDISSDPSAVPRIGLAAFAVGPPRTTATPPGGGFQQAQSVSLACVDNSGRPCSTIYFTTDGTLPQAIPSQQYNGVPIPIMQNTTLKFFGIDQESNQETVKTENYFIDTTAPVVTATFAGGSYGSADLQPVQLLCDDGADGSGCAQIFFSTDGSVPTTASSPFTVPIELDQLVSSSGGGTLTLQFFALDKAGNQGAVRQEVYDIDLAPPVTRSSLADGVYPPPQQVVLTCDDGTGSGCATIYFTLDGSVPSDGTVKDSNGNLLPVSAIYTQPLALSQATQLNVLSLDKAGNRSTALVGIYSFTRQGNRGTTIGALDGSLLILLLMALLRRQRLAGC